MLDRIHGGYVIAVGASIALVASAFVFAVAFCLTLYFALVEGRPFETLLHGSPLPVLFYVAALGLIGGAATSIVAVAVYGFRARWFWRCLMVAAILLLIAAPIGTVIAALGLVLLIRFRRQFPCEPVPATDAP
jgi:hypothetical protein